MSNYSSCPRCGRVVSKSISSNFFPVFTCRKCGTKYCSTCGKGNGTVCPSCGSKEYSSYDKVYAK